MLRTASLGLLLLGLLAARPASAQTKPAAKSSTAKSRTAAQPAPTRPKQATTPPANRVATDGQGEYVAPGLSGAPDEKVTTDYNNQPLKKPATDTSTLSAQPKAEPTPKKTN